MSFPPNLIGPITGNKFMIAAYYNGVTPMVMTTTNQVTTGPPVQFAFKEITDQNISESLAIFTTSGSTPESLLIKNEGPGVAGATGFVNFTGNNTLYPDPVGATVSFFQTTYQPWNPPTLFLSGVSYAILNPNRLQANTNVLYFPPDQTPFYGTLGGAYIVPATWYSQCGSGSPLVIDDPYKSIMNWKCNITPSSTCVPSINTFSWTNQSDCNAGVQYKYCPAGTFCASGTGQCKGPCINGLNCTFANGRFSCVTGSTGSTGGTGSTGSSGGLEWWVWLLIAISIIIVIAIIIAVIIYFVRRGKEDSTPTTTTTDLT